MDDRLPTESPPSMTSLLGGIVSDLQTLIRQEVQLAKVELQREWDKAKSAAGAMAVGVGVLAVGGFFLLVALACVLAIWLPYWAAFLIVGGVLTVLGLVLFYTG